MTADLLDRLQHLDASGVVDECRVEAWPTAVNTDDGGPAGDIIETYHEIRRWASANGVSVHPPFELRRVSSMHIGTIQRLCLPTLCLVVERDHQIVGVYPHVVSDTTVTVPDAIVALEAGGRPWDDLRPPAEAESRM